MGFHPRLDSPPTRPLSPVIPNNVRSVRLTAAAGTNLARASSRDRSHGFPLFSPSTGLYNPKAFIAHAASLGRACAHCRRSSTAATRRCLASVSVRVARVVLSHPLDISALVSRHLTNQLISRGPLPGRNSFGGKEMPPRHIARDYPFSRRAIPVPGVGYPRLTAPFAASPLAGIRSTCMPNPRRQRSF